MIHAYSELYLNDAMSNLGEAFDYAVNSIGLSLDEFMNLFIISGFAERFSKGEPQVISGISGTEMVMDILTKCGITMSFPEARIEYVCSAEYWCGWIIAYYQWLKKISFNDIRRGISMKEVLKLYPIMHEAAEEKFADTVDSIIKSRCKTTKLQEIRELQGCTQKKLAEKSGVNLRTLQQYETRARDINKASAKTVLALADALSCRIEDLLEPFTNQGTDFEEKRLNRQTDSALTYKS